MFTVSIRRQNKLLQTVAEWVVSRQRSTCPWRQWQRRRRQSKKNGVVYHALLSISWLPSTSDSTNRCVFTASGISVSFPSKNKVQWLYVIVGVEQNQGLRESDFRAFWRGRNQGILDWLLHESSSVVICLQVGIHTPFCSSFLDFSCDSRAVNFSAVLILDLFYSFYKFLCWFHGQEFWVGNDELVHMYQERLGYAGYTIFKLPRTNNRGDGISWLFKIDPLIPIINTFRLVLHQFTCCNI